MMKVTSTIAAASLMMLGSMQAGFTADLPADYTDVPLPPAVGSNDQQGIWAAIAYSKVDAKHGFFWGADKRPEAEEAALRHCEKAGGGSCTVVTVFRNHRRWDDDDGSGFPYNHCGALAVSKEAAAGMSVWGATSAPTRKEAEEIALSACEVSGKQCLIREWVCT